MFGVWTNGGAGCLASLIAVSATDSNLPSNCSVGFIVDADGDLYKRDDFASAYASIHTWIGTCPNTAYECFLTGTGDAPTHTGTGTGDGTDQWLACSSDQKWEWNSSSLPESFSGTLKIRRAGSAAIIASAAVTMTLS